MPRGTPAGIWLTEQLSEPKTTCLQPVEQAEVEEHERPGAV